MGLSEWNIGRCSACGDWVVFDRACGACRTITIRPNEGSSEMNTLTNGGITIGSETNGEMSLR